MAQLPERTDIHLNETDHEYMSKTLSAYERILLDIMRGDRSLFVSAEEQDAMWRIVQPVLDYVESNKIQPAFYPFNSGGPEEAKELLNRLDIEWSGDLATL